MRSYCINVITHSFVLVILVSSILLSGCPKRSPMVTNVASETPQMNSSIPASGTYHLVGKDDNLSRIAKKYGSTVQVLAEFNNLKPPYLIREGLRLFIPGDGVESKSEKVENTDQTTDVVVLDNAKLSWPVKGQLISEFGVREGAQHNGITIKAPEGTPIVSAESGRVGYVGSIPGFGNVILVEHTDHPDKLVTVYAHLGEMRTKTGKKIGRREVIGTVGTSGRANVPSLYFEVRSKSKPRNPLFFLDRSVPHESR